MSDGLFRSLAAVIFLVGACISGYYRLKADRAYGEMASLKEEGLPILVPLRLSGLAGWVGILGYMANPAWMAWSHIDLPEWARWLGVGLGVFGDFLAYWIFTNLGTNVTPTVVARPRAQLVTSGPYHWVRHPLYTMGLIGYAGFALLAENWFIGLTAVLVFFMLTIRTQKEEAKLIEKFGDDYLKYMQRTGRFFPRPGERERFS